MTNTIRTSRGPAVEKHRTRTKEYQCNASIQVLYCPHCYH